MGGIPRQAEAFAVVGDEFDSHDGCFFLVDGWIQKTAMPGMGTWRLCEE